MRIAALTLAFAAATTFLPLHAAEARSRGHWITIKHSDGTSHSFRTMRVRGQTMVIVPMNVFQSMSTNGG